MQRLLRQVRGLPVELIAILDNQRRVIGDKRNDLVRCARGEYLVFVDDDDVVPDDFVAALLQGMDANPQADCITFDRHVYFNGQFSHRAECRVGVPESPIQHGHCTAAPNHIALWRTGLAREVSFPSLNMGCDNAWYDQALRRVRRHGHIDRVLYEYHYMPFETTTQRGPHRRRTTQAVCLSILIPTVPARLTTFWPRLITQILWQIGDLPVEVVSLFDNYRRTVGEKRNALLHMANGEYLAFVDDDDQLATFYVRTLLDAIGRAGGNGGTDVIVFDQLLREHTHGTRQKLCRYGIEYGSYTDGRTLWTGPPAHTQCWRAELAKRCTFPSYNYTEDSAWVKQAVQLVRTQLRITGPPLYYYDYDPRTTETRKSFRRNVNRT